MNIFTFDYQPYQISIALSEDLFEKYKEYHWNHPILNVGNIDADVHLNSIGVLVN
ncbi:MAG: hypothetical protein Ta2E_00090 [Mycoplasmoidaceae bacterium]|nr:MAG: hypothetical protein Ta2E_00090 [Mycoplasmoidaceae bacterium]